MYNSVLDHQPDSFFAQSARRSGQALNSFGRMAFLSRRACSLMPPPLYPHLSFFQQVFVSSSWYVDYLGREEGVGASDSDIASDDDYIHKHPFRLWHASSYIIDPFRIPVLFWG